ncbi:hypothetical protein AMTR_s00016p00222200 [Amborella trichopoda]|uniref:Uncharacterized protein n=1 Tax=Amborella trichopoda TaxID=13333 RepID=W1PGS2_AMBTC|nr:hypothetical protein AMTR_s00016p00222200 [Amborella trichopoda]
MRDAASCKTTDIVITQEIVGVVHGDVLQFEVTINNTCYCMQTMVMVYCGGFHTMDYPDPAVFEMLDTWTCIINHGLPVYWNTPLTFRYTWMRPSHFPIMGSDVLCP